MISYNGQIISPSMMKETKYILTEEDKQEIAGMVEGGGGGGKDYTVLVDMTVEEDVEILEIPHTEEVVNAINSCDELCFYCLFVMPTSDEATDFGKLWITERASKKGSSWTSTTFMNGVSLLPTNSVSYVTSTYLFLVCKLSDIANINIYSGKMQNKGGIGGIQYDYRSMTEIGWRFRFEGSHAIGAGSKIKIVAKGTRKYENI